LARADCDPCCDCDGDCDCDYDCERDCDVEYCAFVSKRPLL